MDSSSKQFENQPRLGAAVRQRSHSAKELTSMLQTLQLSVHLMPLSDQASTKQPNLASTSEEESDSNETNSSMSEDEAFCDEDDELDSSLNRLKNYPSELVRTQRNKYQLNNSFTTGLHCPKNLLRLRRSNSLGMLSSLEKKYYCDDYNDVDAEFSYFNSHLNRRNSSTFRSSLPHLRFSSSLKDLNQYREVYSSAGGQQVKHRDNFFDKNEVKSTRSTDGKEFTMWKSCVKNETSTSVDNLFGSMHRQSSSLSDRLRSREANIRQLANYDEKQTSSNVKSTNSGKSSSEAACTDDQFEAKRGCATTSVGLSVPTDGGALQSDCTSGFHYVSCFTSSSLDINNKVNFESLVSCCERSDKYSNEINFLPIKNDHISIQTTSNQPKIESTSEYLNEHITETENNCSSDSDSKTADHLLKKEIILCASFEKTETPQSNQLEFSSDSSLDRQPSTNAESDQLNNRDGLTCYELNDLKNVLLNKPQLLLGDRRTSRLLSKKSHSSELSELSELNELSEFVESDQKCPKSPRMQTLAETQYNQLSYHIAALSCVCDSKQNLTNYSFGSSPNNQSSSVGSSPNSSEYSSPYSSPPSSPSSVSSYSSAEEDCSILSKFNHTTNSSTSNSSNSNKCQHNGSNQSLADLITVDHQQSKETSLDVVDCATAFHSNRHQILLTTAGQLNELNKDKNDEKAQINNDGSQLDNERVKSDQLINDRTDSQSNKTENGKQVRVRKTSILRNQTLDLANYSKKEVKFADTLGFALEKVKYFPPIAPQVKPKRHSVNLASLHRDYYDEHQELFILYSRPQTKDNQTLAKEFEERSALYSKQHSKLNLNTNIFNSTQSRGTYSPPHQSSNSFWASYSSNYQSFSPIRDEYCGDMFHQTFDATGLAVDAQPSMANSSANNNTNLTNSPVNSTVKSGPVKNYPQMVNYKSSSLEFNGMNFMNNQNFSSSLDKHAVSFLPLNFGQPYIQSEFPNRLRSQCVLLHSLELAGNTMNGIISVMNLMFEKKVFVKYTLNKWATEKQCEARYSKKDSDNSDRFAFQISLKESDFPQFQLGDDRTVMFVIRFETGDGRIYYDNNHGADYRLKCKFN